MSETHGKIILSACMVVVLALAVAFISDRSMAAKPSFAPHTLTVVFTGDDWGNVKPCGCGSKGHLGGVARRATYIRQLRESCEHMLLLEIGDAGSGAGEVAQIKARLYAEAFAYMGYDAIGLGDWEARIMRESGQDLYGQGACTICVNVLDVSTGRSLVERPYVIKTLKNGLKVGIISVVGEHLLPERTREDMGIRVVAPADAIRKHLDALQKESDLVVLLSHTGPDVAKRLASEVSGIDVVLSGHLSPQATGAVERIGDTVHMHALRSGRGVSKLVLEIGADRRIVGFSGEHIELDKDTENDAHMEGLVAKHDLDAAAYHAKLRAQYQQVSATSRLPRGPSPFVSAQNCRTCHHEQFESWRKTGHAKAFESLKTDARTKDAECLSCHTTGFGAVGGFTEEYTTPQFKGVQCESCHGPGVRHSRQAAKSDADVGDYGVVMQSTCTQCHNDIHSADFDYKKYKSRIAH